MAIDDGMERTGQGFICENSGFERQARCCYAGGRQIEMLVSTSCSFIVKNVVVDCGVRSVVYWDVLALRMKKVVENAYLGLQILW